jgi:guanidinobutyrase
MKKQARRKLTASVTNRRLAPLSLVLVLCVVASCSEQAPRQEVHAAAPSASAQTVAQEAPAERPQDTSQVQDPGTPEGPHMLGPLSPQTSELPPDYAVIRLDPNAPELDVCKPRDTSEGPRRDPGPIDANGALTFFGLPLAVTPEDLKAGKVEVAIFGAPIDMGVGFRGAGEGPRAFRASRGGGGSMEAMINWRRELKAVDYGNAEIDPFSIERSVPCVMNLVREIADAGAIPVIIGGDHSLEYPNVAGLASKYGKENVGVIHFDSHYDAGPVSERNGHLITHAQPVRRLVDDGWILGKNYIQVGLRGSWPGPEGFEWMRRNNMRYHTMAEIERDGWPAVMDRVLKEANDGPEHLFISFDIDVMDPAYTPGTGTPVPGGLTPREVFPLIRGLCAEKNMVGFDLVELDPLVDPGYTTALNSKQIVNECLTGIAMRKKGLTDPRYLSPLSVDDNRS